MRGPPRLARALARVALSRPDAERLLDALDEEYDRFQRPHRGRIASGLWYWGQVLRSLAALRRGSGARVFRSDVRHLLRQLRRRPASAGATVLGLVLALGAGSCLFAVFDALLLQPLPFHEPEALVRVDLVSERDGAAPSRPVSAAALNAWREHAHEWARLEAFDPTNLTLTGLGPARRIRASDVTPAFLDVLGVDASLGRLFADRDGERDVVVLSHEFWSTVLASDANAVGRELVLGGESHVVIGVLPAGFRFDLNRTEVWRPLAPPLDPNAPVRVVGRLAAGVGAGELGRRLNAAAVGAGPGQRVRVTSLADAVLGDHARTVALLASAGALALLVALANLTMLLFVRAIDRREELAVRTALGAPPFEALRQLLLESWALVGLGVVGGGALAAWATPLAGRIASETVGLGPWALDAPWAAIGLVAGAAFLSAAACAWLPARAVRTTPTHGLPGARATATRSDTALRRVLVGGEVALAFVLLLSVALVGHSLGTMLRTNPGFDPADVLKLQVALPRAAYPTDEEVVVFYRTLQSEVVARLGPGTVSFVDEIPLTGDGGRGRVTAGPGGPTQDVVVRTVGADYFTVLGIPLQSGREFSARDGAQADPHVVITTTLAERLFPDASPLGRSVRIGGRDGTATVIGVVGDVKHRTLDEDPQPTLYLSAEQAPSPSSVLIVRSSRPPTFVIDVVRDAVGRLDASLPVYRVRTMEAVVAASPGVPTRRLLMGTFGAFAVLAIVLCALGLFGIAAHDSAWRRRELALRTVLGATPAGIIRAVLGGSAVTVAGGVGVGLVASVGAVRGLAHLVSTDGTHILVIGAAAVGFVALISSSAVLPVAISAARRDPLSALRDDDA